jgi:hypothetical protein
MLRSILASLLRSSISGAALLTLMLGLGLTGCSRSGDTSAVRLQFPDWSKLQEIERARLSKVSTLAFDQSKVTMVVINITGIGMTPVFFSWEGKNGTNLPPTDISLSVPRGSARLVQALAIYEGDGAMQFYYADSVADTNNDATSIALTLTNAASTSNAVEGRVAGRYLTGVNQGYTGAFQYRFSPPGGKPSMVVHEGELFSGWISDLFALSEPLITYTKPDGSPLFVKADGSALTLTNSSLEVFAVAAPARVLRLHVPAGYGNEAHQSGQYDMRPTSAQRILVGFFGPGVQADQRVCLSSPSTLASATSIDGLFKNLNADGSASSAPANPIKWVGKLTPPSASIGDYAFVAPLTIDSTTFKGGQDQNDNASCDAVSSDAFVKYLKLDGTAVNGHERLVGFRGPFRRPSTAQSSDGGFTQVQYDATTQKLTVSWELLPGVANDLAGMSVFYRTLSSSSEVWNESALRSPGGDGLRCAEFRSGSFSPAFNEVQVSIGTTTAEISGVATSEAAGRTQVVVCPRAADGRYFQSAALGAYFNSSCTNCNAMATKLAIVGPTNSTTASGLFNGTCTTLEIVGQTASGQEAQVPSGTTVNLSASGFEIFTNGMCSSGTGSASLNFNGGSRQTIMVKRTGSGSTAASLSATANLSGATQTATHTLNFADSVAATNIRLIGPSSIRPYECVTFFLETVNVNGSVITPARASGTESVDTPSIAGVDYYYDSTGPCTGGSTSIRSIYFDGTMDYQATRRQVSFIYRGNGTALTLAPTISFGPLPVESRSFTVVQPGTASQLRFNGPSMFSEGDCQPLEISATDSSGYRSPVTAATSLNLSSSLGQFYTDSSCSTATNSVSIAVGTVSAAVYFSSLTQGSATFAATRTAGDALASTTQTVTIGEPYFSQIVKVFPGQTFTNGAGVSGVANALVAGQTYTLTIYAASWANRLASSTAVPVNLSINGGGTVSSATVNFAGGVASFQFTPTDSSNSIFFSGTRADGSGFSDSVMLTVLPSANVVNIYMKAALNLMAGHCQLLALVPEDSNGAAFLPSAKTITVSTLGGDGQLYTSPDCSSGGALIQYVNMSPTDKVAVLFYKKGASGNDQITASSAGLTTTTLALTVGSGTVPTTSSKYLLTGRTASTSLTRCQPYVVSRSDSANLYIKENSDMTMNAWVDSGGGTVGVFFDNPTCSTPYVMYNVGVSLLSSNGYKVLYFNWGTSGATNLLRIGDAFPSYSEWLSLSTY